uniref:Homeobox domain-containing protein n=1 Tax=Caenorhabditis tropicalis TaxID=1561998 RepID=A0A1I7TSP1_9PELO
MQGEMSKKRTEKPPAYSAELRADLLNYFEAGKGRFTLEGKLEIRKKHGLTFHKIVCWANDRRRRHGVYDEKRFCKKLWKYINDNPGCSKPNQDLQNEFNILLIKLFKIEGWGYSKEVNSNSEN